VKNKYIIWLAILVLGLSAGFLLGYFLKKIPVVQVTTVRENNPEYKFIHPLLAVNRSDIPSSHYLPLYENVEKFIKDKKESGVLDDASVYFIDYGKSGSFTINENQKYEPASLLKVIIMIAYLKESELGHVSLNQEYVYQPTIARLIDTIPFEAPSLLKVGHSYSISSLINSMIIDSDNGAKDLLLANISDATLDQVYKDLGLQVPSEDSVYSISAKDYSLFFRILYNSTYLNNKNSEKALEILSKAVFSEGLISGVPSDVIVAHKFGEHVNNEKDKISSIELHDCGILYAPQTPYLLCVMTKGKTEKDLSGVISVISRMVYNAVSVR
jgi:beta-lactamase class A